MTDKPTAGITVALDAMGGDFGPSVVVPGAVEALRDSNDYRVALYGDADAIAAEIDRHGAGDLPCDVVSCTQDIEMGEAAASAIRGKPDSPIVRAMRDHKEGAVGAVVSAGSTGAMVAGSLMLLGRLPHVDRPAIATVIPTLESAFLLLDAGANVQCTPEHLLCFARMGALYGATLLDLDDPRVGLLNIGEESSKGTELCIESHKLLSAASDLPFIGNVESRGLLHGEADVVVTDGFTGNMVLKLIEGFGGFLQAVASGSSAGGGGLGQVLQRMDYAAYGGAMLLGVRGTSIISHGASSSRAIANAVRNAAKMSALDMPSRLEQTLASLA
jgi:glycerol-3-phosphate acyltransferase PlsX